MKSFFNIWLQFPKNSTLNLIFRQFLMGKHSVASYTSQSDTWRCLNLILSIECACYIDTYMVRGIRYTRSCLSMFTDYNPILEQTVGARHPRVRIVSLSSENLEGHIAPSVQESRNSKIGTFQVRQKRFSIYVIFTYKFSAVGHLWQLFLRAQLWRKHHLGRKIAVSYEGNNLKTHFLSCVSLELKERYVLRDSQTRGIQS